MAANTVGCTLNGAATKNAYATTCAAAAANKYPVATSFPTFVVQVDGNGQTASTIACYTSAVTKCGTSTATPTNTVYTVRAPTGSVLSGCTSGPGDATLCTPWWTLVSGSAKTCAVQT